MRTEQVKPRPFEHVHAQKAVLCRRVMRVFSDAKRRFLVHLRPEDVAQALDAGVEEGIEAALTALVDWGNLRADPDTSRVTTVEDFYRARYLYQLTPEGEAVEVALAAYEQALGRRGELQSVAVEDIRVRARSLVHQAESAEPDAAIVHNLLRELTVLLEGLAANASDFMSSLQRTIELQDADEDAFISYKDRLIHYLERFIGDLQVKSAEIASTLRQLDTLGTRSAPRDGGRTGSRRRRSWRGWRRCSRTGAASQNGRLAGALVRPARVVSGRSGPSLTGIDPASACPRCDTRAPGDSHAAPGSPIGPQ
jgi:uncharacterized protein (TIGR02677 family)